MLAESVSPEHNLEFIPLTAPALPGHAPFLIKVDVSELTPELAIQVVNEALLAGGEIRSLRHVRHLVPERADIQNTSHADLLELGLGAQGVNFILKRPRENILGEKALTVADPSGVWNAMDLEPMTATPPVSAIPSLLADIRDQDGKILGVVKSYVPGYPLHHAVKNKLLSIPDAHKLFEAVYDHFAKQGWYLWDTQVPDLIVNVERSDSANTVVRWALCDPASIVRTSAFERDFILEVLHEDLEMELGLLAA